MPKNECPDLQLRPDEPIARSDHDDLDRDRLAESIASKILSRNSESCMVVGISGPWGSGKTSLLNLIEERIGKAAEEKQGILILRFNPWRYTTVEQLIAAFLSEIRRVAGLIDKEELKESIGSALDRMAVALLALSAIPALQPAALFAAGAKATAKVIKAMTRKESLEDIKDELNGYLREAGVHLVILVDDLDRAEPECVRLMLQLIRMNADFSATTYVLAYDRERTARALSSSLRMRRSDGRDYLSKLVQVPFDLPAIESIRLKVAAADVANPLYEVIFNNSELDIHHREVMDAGLYDLFECIRDAKRFANALAVTLPLVWDEVNAVDFAVLEAIRLKFPRLYEKLPENKWLLLNEPRGPKEAVEDYILRDKKPDREGHQKMLEALLGFAGERKSLVRSILEALFPLLLRLRFEHSPWKRSEDPSWYSQRLVCSSSHFDSYFFLAPGARRVSEHEIGETLLLAGDRERFAGKLVALNNEGKMWDMLRRLPLHAEQLNHQDIEAAIGGFLDVADELDSLREARSDSWHTLSVRSFFTGMVNELGEPSVVADVVERAIKTSSAVCILTRFADVVLEMGSDYLTGSDGKERVTRAICDRLLAAVKSREILKSPCPIFVLGRWLEWAEEEARESVTTMVRTQEGVLDLLRAIHRTGGTYSESSGYIQPDIERVVEIVTYLVGTADELDTILEECCEAAGQESHETKAVDDEQSHSDTELLRAFRAAVVARSKSSLDDLPQTSDAEEGDGR